ncbi:MAG: hypothetical protein MUE76_08105 [Syntrophales bacterium]|nr:hypothetical protein [Syntrophales bacterium]
MKDFDVSSWVQGVFGSDECELAAICLGEGHDGRKILVGADQGFRGKRGDPGVVGFHVGKEFRVMAAVSDQQHPRHETPPRGSLWTAKILEYKGEIIKKMACIITEKGHQVNGFPRPRPDAPP